MARRERSERPVVVFISSTSEDLEPYREKVRDAVQEMGMVSLMSEYNPSRGDMLALPECMRRVREADVVVAIAAHWYGWIPEDQPPGDDGPGQKSITWLEADEAWKAEIEVLGFVVETNPKSWFHKKESDDLAELSADDSKFADKVARIQRRMALLEGFKKEISKYQRKTFESEGDLAAKVTASLSNWCKRHGLPGDDQHDEAVDAKPYLKALANETGEIDIKGIRRAQREATRLSIVDLYIPLVYEGTDVQQSPGGGAEAAREHVPLEEALDPSPTRLLIVGDPGTGKSTFSRRLAHVASFSSSPGLKKPSKEYAGGVTEPQRVGGLDRGLPVEKIGRHRPALL